MISGISVWQVHARREARLRSERGGSDFPGSTTRGCVSVRLPLCLPSVVGGIRRYRRAGCGT